jgi:putative FmdB family regulatory protein
MPTYEYECRSCGADFEVFQSMSDAPITVCPSCGQGVRRKINGGTGVIFKGSGFYKNDSRKSPPSESGASPSKSASEKDSSPKAEGGSGSSAGSTTGTSSGAAATSGGPGKKDST